jgi:hypothetical protein
MAENGMRTRNRSRREVLGLIAGGVAGMAASNVTRRADAATRAGFASPLADVSALAQTATGIDYSSARPRPSAIASAGFSFAIRYHSNSNAASKNLTRAEANALRSAGLNVVSNWEDGSHGALNGARQGISDAIAADSHAATCGQPADRPIYFAVDFDAQPSRQPVLNDYFDGVASVLGRSRTGAYGGYDVINRLFNASKIAWGWQTYAWSGGRWDSRAQLRQVKNGIRVDGGRCDRDEAWAADYGGWNSGRRQGTASVYGVLADRRLTYSEIDIGAGARRSALISTTKLPFRPVAMATINSNTILLTDTAFHLYRIDITSNRDALTYTISKPLGSTWSHRLLTYDGSAHLFGLAGHHLLRYNLTADKPTGADITSRLDIGGGFTGNTLTSTAPDHLLATVSPGELVAYQIDAGGQSHRQSLRATGWPYKNVLSPGGGVYFTRTNNDGLLQYVDANPLDGSGSDIGALVTIASGGWTQILLSAQPDSIR